MENRTTEELVEELVSLRAKITTELAEELLRRPDADPSLVKLVREDKFWDWNGPGSGWAPFHAINLLSAKRSIEGLKAMEEVLRARPDDLGDFLTEDMASILANFDEIGLETIRGLASDKNLDIFVRNAAIRALNVIAHRHPELRAPTIDLYLRLMGEERDNKAFLDLNALEFAQLKDPAIYEEIKSLYEQGVVKGESCDFKYIKEVYAMPDAEMDYHQDEKNPMDHFQPKNLEHLGKVNREWAESDLGEPVLEVRTSKIGRNDPCPCGSGKKYKKCCWWRDLELEPPSL
jgi:hypothetical protein